MCKLLLALGEFTAPAIVDAEAGDDAIDDQETVGVGGEGLGEGLEEVELVFAVDGAGVGDVLECDVWVHWALSVLCLVWG